ncbi:hypothetical protein ABSA28_00946 [Candidatus Hepatincolaceae symbiont of Richtersius coronifer]
MKFSKIFIMGLMSLAMFWSFSTQNLSAASSYFSFSTEEGALATEGFFVSVQTSRSVISARDLKIGTSGQVGPFAANSSQTIKLKGKNDDLYFPITVGFDFRHAMVMLTYKNAKHKFSNKENKIDANTKSETLMLDVAYKVANKTILTPYIGVGVGMARERTSIVGGPEDAFRTNGKNKSSIVGAGFAGVEIGLNRHVALVVDYRVQSLAKVSSKTTLGGSFANINYNSELKRSYNQSANIKLKVTI